MFARHYVLVLLIVTAASAWLCLLGVASHFITFPGYHRFFHVWNLSVCIKFFCFSLILSGVIIRFRKIIIQNLADFLGHASQSGMSRPARIILIFGISLYGTYMLKLHLGIFHRGVPNWNYSNLRHIKKPEIPGSFPSELWAGINIGNAPRNEDYIARGQIELIHFKNHVMPFNKELLGLTFLHEIYRKPSEFKKLFEIRYNRYRKNKAFLIPENISYGQHINYSHIDYREYPPFREIKKISSWRAIIEVKQGKINPQSARLINEVEF